MGNQQKLRYQQKLRGRRGSVSWPVRNLFTLYVATGVCVLTCAKPLHFVCLPRVCAMPTLRLDVYGGRAQAVHGNLVEYKIVCKTTGGRGGAPIG